MEKPICGKGLYLNKDQNRCYPKTCGVGDTEFSRFCIAHKCPPAFPYKCGRLCVANRGGW